MASACAGCSGPNSQLQSCQADKDQLLATIREQRDANRTMHEQVASLERRLDESEKELARRGGPSNRLSKSQPLEDTKLPWRSPADSRPTASSSKSPRTSQRGGSLAALAARDDRLALDNKSGVASLNIDVPFGENSAELTAASRRQLDDVAKLLRSKDAAELRVMIAGSATGRPPKTGEGAFTSARQLAAARAQAVADYLDSHGIAGDRLAVAGAGSQVAASEATTKAGTSGVQILLAEPETPVIGWNTGASTLRR
jgi:outer membrane protein OmpA-like peptidoglycan-associated protein